jgi:hypothetical protein
MRRCNHAMADSRWVHHLAVVARYFAIDAELFSHERSTTDAYLLDTIPPPPPGHARGARELVVSA